MQSAHALDFESVNLAQNPGLMSELLSGQINALTALGVEGAVLGEEDYNPPPGTYASIVRDPLGEVLGGVRIHTRSSGRPLPLESGSNPFGPDLQRILAATQSVCEIKGLWVSRHAAGLHLSRKITAQGTALAYLLGHESVVGMAHARAFELISGTLGYVKDSRFPSIPYPDERFMSHIVWHRTGLDSLRSLEAQSPRSARRAMVGNA
jgi:hypothetical protein